VISTETVKEFQATVLAEFGVALNEKDATEVLYNWVAYFDLLAKIDSRQKPQTS